MILRTLLVLISLIGANAMARTSTPLDSSIAQVLLNDKNIDDAYTVEANMGWVVTAMQVECSSIEILDPILDESKIDSSLFACYIRPLVRFSQYPQGRTIEITDGTVNKTKLNLLKTLVREGYGLNISKLTATYGGNITCFTPAATGNPNDKASCELWRE